MAKRKFRRSQKVSDDETGSQKPAKQLKKPNKSDTEIHNISFSSLSSYKVEPDSSGDSDICDSGATADDTTEHPSFSSFMNDHSFKCDESGNDRWRFSEEFQKLSLEHESSVINKRRRKFHEEVSCPSTSSPEKVLAEESEPDIRKFPVPSKLSEIVILEHPASLTLHGYVQVSVIFGSVYIFGYNVKEDQNIKVFSTEGTGLKKIVTSISKQKLEIEILEKKIKKIVTHTISDDPIKPKNIEVVDVGSIIDNIGPSSVVLLLKKIILPAPLQFLELYYPAALQTRWVRSETSENEKNFTLCSTEESYVIDISSDFKMLSKSVNKVISKADGTDCAPCIFVRGEKNTGKSTLIRYLMNSALNKVDEVYFLDTDPGQTEYTPPGVVSLFRVTKPLLGPTFAHQKKPLKMIFIGSITPSTSPKLYESSVARLVKYFHDKFPKKTLFVNTMGWVQGMGEVCIQNIKHAVKPTIEIVLVAPDPELSLTDEVDENEVRVIQVPSKAPTRESGAPSYNPVQLRNFNLVAYLGQCQKPFLPVSLINSFHPVCVSWDKIALYVMERKVPAHRLVEAMHCSIVALCHVDLSYMLKSDNPDFPMTLIDEPICECLGFGLIRASDETNHLFYIVTPLTLDQLKNVNALVKGNIRIPDEIFLKQTIQNVPLPFTKQSKVAKAEGLKNIPRRAFRNTLTPKNTP